MNLARLIEVRKIKQVPLARALGVVQAAVSRWTNDRALPRPKSVLMIERLLKARCDWNAYAKGRLEFRIEKRGKAS